MNKKTKTGNPAKNQSTVRRRTAPAFCLLVFSLLAFSLLAGCSSGEKAQDNTAQQKTTTDSDLVISTGDVSSAASFYPVSVDGTKLEVIAVKAPDGSIRTAFNTCQVCYDSGRGYYKQEGDTLVCQNCGNRFSMSQVEQISGGCNPVPILPENKTETADSITVPLSFLQQAEEIFSNWRSDY